MERPEVHLLRAQALNALPATATAAPAAAAAAATAAPAAAAAAAATATATTLGLRMTSRAAQTRAPSDPRRRTVASFAYDAALPSPFDEVFEGCEGWGPWWVPRAAGHTRSSVRTFIAGLVGERYSDLGVRAVRGTAEWRGPYGWWFTVDAAGLFAAWEVYQR
ncbi:MAG: hypothetical protein ABSG64_13005 [Solirubrobacteraceae bacterium]